MRGDLSIIGLQASRSVRVAASATRYEVGEPLHSVATYSSGVASANTFVLAAADTPVIGTHNFGGVALSNCQPFSTGTVVAHTAWVAAPVPQVGIVRGKGETLANVDTDAEILLIIMDKSLIDYNATGASDGGELYTIKDTAAADVNGLTIIAGNAPKGTLDAVVDSRAYCLDVT